MQRLHEALLSGRDSRSTPGCSPASALPGKPRAATFEPSIIESASNPCSKRAATARRVRAPYRASEVGSVHRTKQSPDVDGASALQVRHARPLQLYSILGKGKPTVTGNTHTTVTIPPTSDHHARGWLSVPTRPGCPWAPRARRNLETCKSRLEATDPPPPPTYATRVLSTAKEFTSSADGSHGRPWSVGSGRAAHKAHRF